MMKFFKFKFVKRLKSERIPLNEQEVADYIKSKDDLAEANKNLQEVIRENHFSLNIKKALHK